MHASSALATVFIQNILLWNWNWNWNYLHILSIVLSPDLNESYRMDVHSLGPSSSNRTCNCKQTNKTQPQKKKKVSDHNDNDNDNNKFKRNTKIVKN